jgi:hypothetical protein
MGVVAWFGVVAACALLALGAPGGPFLCDRLDATAARLELEVQVLQQGARRLALRSPWLLVPAAVVGLTATWAAYWVLALPLLLAFPCSRLLRPLERAARRRAVGREGQR